MPKIIGRRTSVGIAKEATRGTAVAPTYWVPVNDLDFDDTPGYIDNDSGMGVIAELNDSVLDRLHAEGGYSGKIYDQSVGVELTALFGQSPTSVQRATSGVYDHTWSLLNSNEHASLSLSYYNVNQDLRYALGMLNTWSLELELENFVRRSASYIAKTATAAAGNTVAFTDQNEFISTNVTFKQAAAAAGLDAAAAISIRNFNMEVNKNAVASYVMKSGGGYNEPDDINNRQFAVTGSFQIYFADTTQRALVLAGTKKAMRIDIVNEDVDLGSGHNPALRFDLNSVSLREHNRDFDNNDLMMANINFSALYSIADAAMITGRLTNAHAGTNY